MAATFTLFTGNSINTIGTGSEFNSNSINTMGTTSAFNANSINTIETTPITFGTTIVPAGTTTVPAGTTVIALGTTFSTSAVTTSSTVIAGHSSLVVTTNTLSDSDDGVVLFVGNTTPLIAHNALVLTNPLTVTNGTLSITSDSILGDNTVQSFPVHGSVFFGGPVSSALTIHPGDIAFAGDGGDTISVVPVSLVPLSATGTSLDRAFVFGGDGNDTILDFSTTGALIPLTAVGGPGNDTFVVESVAPQGTTFTGGPGNDLFHFSTLPTHSANVTITDFSSHDAIAIDVSPTLPTSISITNSGNATMVDAVGSGGGAVHLTLVGTFDQSQFHVANDGNNHAVITFGNSDFVLS